MPKSECFVIMCAVLFKIYTIYLFQWNSRFQIPDEPPFCYNLWLQKAPTKERTYADIKNNSRIINTIENETNEC